MLSTQVSKVDSKPTTQGMWRYETGELERVTALQGLYLQESNPPLLSVGDCGDTLAPHPIHPTTVQQQSQPLLLLGNIICNSKETTTNKPYLNDVL